MQIRRTLRNKAEAVSESVIECLPGIFYLFDSQGKFLKWNKNFEKISGYSAKELSGMGPLDFFAGGDKRLLEQRISDVFTKGEATAEAEFISKGGFKTPYFFTGVMTTIDDTKCLVGMGIDITERKLAEEALRNAHARLEGRVQEKTAQILEQSQILESFFAHTQTCLVFLDREFNFVRVNDAYARVCGREVSDFIGHNHFVDYPSEELREKFLRVVETKTPYVTYGRPFVFPDHLEWGVTYWDLSVAPILDSEGKVELLIFSLLDVTPRTLAEEERKRHGERLEEVVKEQTEAFQQSLSRFELLVVTAGELLQSTEPQQVVESVCHKVMEYLDCHVFFNFLADGESGKLRLNACAGIPEEEARRIQWLDYGVAVCGCAAKEGVRIVAEHIQVTPDERTYLVKSYGIKAYCCHPLLGPGGRVIGTLSFGTRSRETFTDDELSLMKAVADQVAAAMIRMRNEADVLKLSEDMAARNVELESVNRELESFIYSISHDLRSPLRSMGAFATIMIEDFSEKLDERGRDYLKRISGSSEKMTRLINDLLDLSKISRQEIRRTKIDVTAAALSVLSELRRADPGRNVEIAVEEGLTAFADGTLTELILSNLLDNAWKFTSKTEHACIEFGAMTCGEEESSVPAFYVRDNGAGFDPHYREKIFLPFQRLHTEQDFPGTGMGLTIVERVVHRHGGQVWAEGEVGKGVTVYFTLG